VVAVALVAVASMAGMAPFVAAQAGSGMAVAVACIAGYLAGMDFAGNFAEDIDAVPQSVAAQPGSGIADAAVAVACIADHLVGMDFAGNFAEDNLVEGFVAPCQCKSHWRSFSNVGGLRKMIRLCGTKTSICLHGNIRVPLRPKRD